MCLLPAVVTSLTHALVSAALVVSPGHPSYRGQIIMQSTGSFRPGAGGTACTRTKGCYCSLLGLHKKPNQPLLLSNSTLHLSSSHSQFVAPKVAFKRSH